MIKYKLKEYACEYIPFDVRESIWKMESQLALIFGEKSKECGVGLNIHIPTLKQLFDNKDIKYLVCYKGKKIIGYISYYSYDIDKSNMDRGVVYFHNIFILDEYRKQGIAKKLVRYVMEKNDDKYYQFTIMGENEASLNLMKSVGLYSKPLYSVYTFHTDYDSFV